MSTGEWMSTKKRIERKRPGSNAFANDWNSYEGRVGVKLGGRKNQRINTQPSKFLSTNSRGERKSIGSASSNFQKSNSSTNQPTGQSNALNENLQNEMLNLLPTKSNPKPKVKIPDTYNSSLNKEQRAVIESVLSGYSTFFTGPAGSGKSHVLSTILKFNEEGTLTKKKRVVLTATTGISACNIGGTTIHSFAGVGTGQAPLNEMIAKVMGNEYARERWRNVDILVIDEISMMPATFLDHLDFIAKRVRNDRRSFGGLQVVFCGDFFQLPPVNLNKNQFSFEAKCWHKVINASIKLKQIFRQNEDTTFMTILNQARIGELSKSSVKTLGMHCYNSKSKLQLQNRQSQPHIKPTVLECRNQQVDHINLEELSKLPHATHTFSAKDVAVSKNYEMQLRNCSAPQKLSLKIGAQVILLKNLDPDNGLVNGSRGVVVDFQRNPKINFDLPREFRQIELPVVQFDKMCTVSNQDKMLSSDRDDRQKLIEPSEWINKVGEQIISSRIQIPLKLAWALSVHKSQGMTIPHLSLSLRGVFEYGQAYVALSRATKLDFLTITGFHEGAFKAHPKVKVFYKMLENREDDNEVNSKSVSVVNHFSTASSNNQISSQPMFISNKEEFDAHEIQKKNTNTKKSYNGSITLTEEQRKRLEANKSRALELQRKRLKKK